MSDTDKAPESALATRARNAAQDAAFTARDLYTAPIVDMVARLLADMYAAGEHHDISPDDWIGDLPGSCLETVASSVHQTRRDLDHTTIERLLQDAAAGSNGRGLTTQYDPDAGLVTMAPAGFLGRLSLSLTAEQGWILRLPSVAGTPKVTIHAPFTGAGAKAIADLIVLVALGQVPGTFTTR